MVLALGMDSKKRLKSTFILWMTIKTFRFKESVTLKRKTKDMGELLAVATSRGKCHWEKIWAVLASRLTAIASGCSSLTCRHKWQDGQIWETVDRLDWDSTTVLGQASCLPLLTAMTGSIMAWTKSERENVDYILFCLSLFSFHINVLMIKTRKPLHFSGTVTFLFFQVRYFLFSCFCNDVFDSF